MPKIDAAQQREESLIVWLMAGFRRIFAERFDRARIGDAATLARFVRTRAAYVAQTSLYGYLKTRMGTSFARHFEDDEFSRVIRRSAERLFVSCLSDLTIFAVATVSGGGRMAAPESAALARRCFRDALAHEAAGLDPSADMADDLARFDARAAATIWDVAATGEAAFAGSAADLVRLAPVIDEYKALDEKIVVNSIRFRWRDVRDQIRRRVDRDALAMDWQGPPGT